MWGTVVVFYLGLLAIAALLLFSDHFVLSFVKPSTRHRKSGQLVNLLWSLYFLPHKNPPSNLHFKPSRHRRLLLHALPTSSTPPRPRVFFLMV
mmetsp:Transcript_3749/g.8842  ORF Transcript_3749/g.8842 Transcript_3749/m.8842 type:complete len:93 (+) Transcript_3749:543-821(+)